MAPCLTRIVSSFKMGKFRNKNSKIKGGPKFSNNKHSLFGEYVWKWVALGCFMRTSFTGIWQGEWWGIPWPFVMCIWSPPLKQKKLVFEFLWRWSIIFFGNKGATEKKLSTVGSWINKTLHIGMAPHQGPFYPLLITRRRHGIGIKGAMMVGDCRAIIIQWVTIDGPLDATVNRNAETAQATY